MTYIMVGTTIWGYYSFAPRKADAARANDDQCFTEPTGMHLKQGSGQPQTLGAG
jgi:hypothetical protein